jgi:hypothetical protein
MTTMLAQLTRVIQKLDVSTNLWIVMMIMHARMIAVIHLLDVATLTLYATITMFVLWMPVTKRQDAHSHPLRAMMTTSVPLTAAALWMGVFM